MVILMLLYKCLAAFAAVEIMRIVGSYNCVKCFKFCVSLLVTPAKGVVSAVWRYQIIVTLMVNVQSRFWKKNLSYVLLVNFEECR